MNKSELVQSITQLLTDWSPVFQTSGINVDAYKQEFDKRTVPSLKEGLAWLKERAETIEEYKKVRALRTEEIWERYAFMDTQDLREVVMLKEVISKVRKVFVKRPAVFRKLKTKKKEI